MVDITERTVWANNETQVSEPSSTLQDAGYAPLEQPYNEHHNWIWNSRDKQINKLLIERNYQQRFAHTIPIGNQVSGQLGDPYNVVHPYASLNEFSLVAGNPICICPAWDYSVDRPCVYIGVDGYSGIVRVRNISTGLYVQNLPLSFLEGTEYVESIVSEGDAFYVMTKGHSSGNVYFYRFSANPFSATPVWSSGYSGGAFLSLGRNGLCIAGDWLATVLTGITLPTGPLVRLIRKSDAGATAQGSGNAGSLSAGYRPGWGITSNGISIFFSMFDPTVANRLYLCGADVSNPAQATYPAGGAGPYAWSPQPLEGTAAVNVGSGDLVYDGRLVHILSTNGHIGSYEHEYNVWAASNKAIWKFEYAKTPIDEQEHASMCFDGFYGYTLLEYDGASNINNSFISSVRLADTSIDRSSTEYPFILKPPNCPQIMLGPPRPQNPVTYLTKMVHSDNSLWILPRIKLPAYTGTTLIRLPNTWARR